MKKINIAFGIHNHQPVGNFDFVFEEAYQKSYLPFLELLERHPKIRMAQHYSGILFKWIKENKPEFIPRLRKLVESGQIEMMTGGFYEPIMSIIPYEDKVGQIKKLSNLVREETGYEPIGMWLAERIWEPHLPKPVSEAGVKYLVLDDSHFKNAGVKDEDLLSYYITEEEGATVYLFPISEQLRYAIPFQPPEYTIDYLRSIATEKGDRLVVFADDGEKFGAWPDTYEHCYENGWLEQFFHALEDNADWVNIIQLSEALTVMQPKGRIYLPTASYREMMEWAMPTGAIKEYEQFEQALKQQQLHDRFKVFVRGGFWRNFLAKYPESNNMHKKMLHLRKRLTRLAARHGEDEKLKSAQDHLWAGQCNCPYWHGVFGGVYLNHLRYATYHEFIQCEVLLDELDHGQGDWLAWEKTDFDGDGREEIIVSNRLLSVCMSPHVGGSVFELDFKPKALNVMDTMTRREESYHSKLVEAAQTSESQQHDPNEIRSIHDLVVMKEEGLDKMLFYDHYRRVSCIDHFLKEGTNLSEFANCTHEAGGDFVESEYQTSVEESAEGLRVTLTRQGQVLWPDGAAMVELRKEIVIPRNLAELHVSYSIRNCGSESRSFWFGSEWDFSLLAGDAPDRYFVFPGHELADRRLKSSGEVADASEARLLDEWLGVEVSVKTDRRATFWRFPIETISQSEAGFERVYQSSVVLPHWRFDLDSGDTWHTQIRIAIREV